jgi:hypothetical protein
MSMIAVMASLRLVKISFVRALNQPRRVGQRRLFCQCRNAALFLPTTEPTSCSIVVLQPP